MADPAPAAPAPDHGQAHDQAHEQAHEQAHAWLPRAELFVHLGGAGRPGLVTLSTWPGGPVLVEAHVDEPGQLGWALAHAPLPPAAPAPDVAVAGAPLPPAEHDRLRLAWLRRFGGCTDEYLIALLGLACAPEVPHACPGEGCALLHAPEPEPEAVAVAAVVAPTPDEAALRRLLNGIRRQRGIPRTRDAVEKFIASTSGTQASPVRHDEFRAYMRRVFFTHVNGRGARVPRHASLEFFLQLALEHDLEVAAAGEPARARFEHAVNCARAAAGACAGWSELAARMTIQHLPRDVYAHLVATMGQTAWWDFVKTHVLVA